MDMSGKVALVTGGGSGIGRAVAHALADEGCRVVIVGRREARLRETLDAYAGAGAIDLVVADVSRREDVRNLFVSVTRQWGPTDILVNAAGVNIPHRKMSELSQDDWDYLIRVNLNGPFHMIHAVLPSMRERREGLIINISSIAGLRPSPLGGVAYSASKYGLNGLTGTIGIEEASFGIRCTAICPGEVDTPILESRPEPLSPERLASILQPSDVAAAVLFVCNLPPRAHVPELIIKPTSQPFA